MASNKSAKLTLEGVRRIVREELLREWQDVPQSFDQFLQQQRIAAKDMIPGIDRILGSYEASSSALDDNDARKAFAVAILRSAYQYVTQNMLQQAPAQGQQQQAPQQAQGQQQQEPQQAQGQKKVA